MTRIEEHCLPIIAQIDSGEVQGWPYLQERQKDPVLLLVRAIRDARAALTRAQQETFKHCTIDRTGRLVVVDSQALAEVNDRAEELEKKISHNQKLIEELEDVLASCDEPLVRSMKVARIALKERISACRNPVKTGAVYDLDQTEAEAQLDDIERRLAKANEIVARAI
jgi:uncharacterized coiled-coil protein SlyX